MICVIATNGLTVIQKTKEKKKNETHTHTKRDAYVQVCAVIWKP